ncbi:MAG: MaoC/PaaZ C-terminal domain-containing protein [Gammaproteobacteria bacterium]|nr:MaoC/PaaZ C-terminal domain-containing protein [Gammaproteobacteria bacterium]
MTTNLPNWDSLHIGDAITPLVKRPTPVQLFMFSAVTWNRHQIHYNKDYANHDGLPDVAVHRALLGNFLAQMLTDWLGDAGRISKIEWSVRAGARPGDTLTCTGNITGKHEEDGKRYIEADMRIENQDGTLIAPGKATLLIY